MFSLRGQAFAILKEGRLLFLWKKSSSKSTSERNLMIRPRTILVADDDRMTREVIGAILLKAGHHVLFAEDGQSALQIATSQKPDLVLIDGLMPKMHGFLACKAIKELPEAPKVILLTAVYTKPSYKCEA